MKKRNSLFSTTLLIITLLILGGCSVATTTTNASRSFFEEGKRQIMQKDFVQFEKVISSYAKSTTTLNSFTMKVANADPKAKTILEFEVMYSFVGDFKKDIYDEEVESMLDKSKIFEAYQIYCNSKKAKFIKSTSSRNIYVCTRGSNRTREYLFAIDDPDVATGYYYGNAMQARAFNVYSVIFSRSERMFKKSF